MLRCLTPSRNHRVFVITVAQPILGLNTRYTSCKKLRRTICSPEDADIVKQNLPDIASDTPRTALAAQKVQQAIDKGGQQMRDAVKGPLLLLVASGARAIFAWIST